VKWVVVGYCGGTTPNPTYENIGNYSETIQIKYDPQKISYSKLLEAFFEKHDSSAITSIQYASRIFYHDEDQKKLAEEKLSTQHDATTIIVKFESFHDAEDYHQHYILKNSYRKLFKQPLLMEISNEQKKRSELCSLLSGFCSHKDKSVLKQNLKEIRIKSDEIEKLLELM